MKIVFIRIYLCIAAIYILPDNSRESFPPAQSQSTVVQEATQIFVACFWMWRYTANTKQIQNIQNSSFIQDQNQPTVKQPRLSIGETITILPKPSITRNWVDGVQEVRLMGDKNISLHSDPVGVTNFCYHFHGQQVEHIESFKLKCFKCVIS